MSHDDGTIAKVEIANPETLWKFAQARTGRKRRGMTTRSFILTSNDQFQEILPQSDRRIEAWITAIIAEQLNEPANPAAGNPFVFTVTQPCQLESAFMKLATSASAGNRFANITIADAAGNIIAQAVNNTATAASLTTTLSTAQGIGQVTSAGAATASLPVNLVLQPGWTITFGATGLLAGDQVSNISFTLTNPASVTVGKAKNDVQAANNSGIIIPASGTPLPLNTTDQVWAGAAFTPTTISVLAIYEQAD